DRGHPGNDEIGVPQFAQFDVPCAIGKAIRDLANEPQRQPRLSDPACPAQRQRAGGTNQLPQFAEFPLPADEAVRFLGQIGGDLYYLFRLSFLDSLSSATGTASHHNADTTAGTGPRANT